MASRCSSCGAAIIWCVAPSGRRMPVDAEPTDGGNLEVTEVTSEPNKPPEPRCLNVSSADRTGKALHKSHFATCPQSSQHRKGK